MKCLRVFTRPRRLAVTLVIVAACFLGGCAGEGFITYRGAVFAHPDGSLTFDDAPNPRGSPPIAGATVRLSVCTESCSGSEPVTTATSDERGQWGPLDRTIGGLAGTRHVIRIEFVAEGFEPIVYTATFEDTSDPLDGERYLNAGLPAAG